MRCPKCKRIIEPGIELVVSTKHGLRTNLIWECKCGYIKKEVKDEKKQQDEENNSLVSYGDLGKDKKTG